MSVDIAEVREHLLRWVEARRDYGIEPVLIEQTVCNVNVGYAGTMDRAVQFRYPDIADLFHDGCRLAHVLDVKTGAKVWPDVALQLSGYANATHTWDHASDRTVPLEGVCREVGIVAALHADRCDMYPVRLVEAWSTFAAATLAWRWAEEDSKECLGDPVPNPALAMPW